MKIAIPLANGLLCMHFGHCAQFAIVETDDVTGKVAKVEYLTPPPHEPGVLPRWLCGMGVGVVIAGGMGPAAQQLLASQGVKVFAGAPAMRPEELAEAYVAGRLTAGVNVCNHLEAGAVAPGGHGHGHGCV